MWHSQLALRLVRHRQVILPLLEGLQVAADRNMVSLWHAQERQWGQRCGCPAPPLQLASCADPQYKARAANHTPSSKAPLLTHPQLLQSGAAQALWLPGHLKRVAWQWGAAAGGHCRGGAGRGRRAGLKRAACGIVQTGIPLECINLNSLVTCELSTAACTSTNTCPQFRTCTLSRHLGRQRRLAAEGQHDWRACRRRSLLRLLPNLLQQLGLGLPRFPSLIGGLVLRRKHLLSRLVRHSRRLGKALPLVHLCMGQREADTQLGWCKQAAELCMSHLPQLLAAARQISRGCQVQPLPLHVP